MALTLDEIAAIFRTQGVELQVMPTVPASPVEWRINVGAEGNPHLKSVRRGTLLGVKGQPDRYIVTALNDRYAVAERMDGCLLDEVVIVKRSSVYDHDHPNDRWLWRVEHFIDLDAIKVTDTMPDWAKEHRY